MNKAIIIGNLGADPELNHTQGGQAVCKFRVATTREWTNKQTNQKQKETEWHRITVWGAQGETCAQYLEKGREVAVDGRIKTSEYTQDGIKKYSTEIVADRVQFLGSRNDAPRQQSQGGGHDAGNYQAPPGGDDIPF